MTNKHRLYFKPMEKLAIQELDSVKVEEYELNDELDTKFKPGLYNEVNAFLNNKGDERMINIKEHLENVTWYARIAGLDVESIKVTK